MTAGDTEPEKFLDHAAVPDGLAVLLDDSVLAVCRCDLQCVVRAGNAAFARLIGVAPAALPGLPLLRGAAPEGLDALLHHLRRACSGEVQAFVFRGRRIGGDGEFHAIGLALPLMHHGVPRGIACVLGPPVSDARGDEAELHRALDHLGEAAVILDADGRVFWSNRAYTRVTGFDGRLANGKPPGCFPADLLLRHARRALREGEPWEGEIEGRHADGRALRLLVMLSALDGDAGTRWLACFRDISGVHPYNQQLGMVRAYRVADTPVEPQGLAFFLRAFLFLVYLAVIVRILMLVGLPPET